jgi:transcriptional regulator, AraC family
MLSLDVPFNRLTLLSDYTELSQLIRDLRQEFHQTGSHHEEILDAKLRTILYKYSDAYHLETQLSDKLKIHRPLFHEIRNGIYSQHSPKKTVSELAEDASLSVSYFQHIYKELFGVPVIQDIIRSRIERACYLLTMTPDSVAHIAESCGYENVEHFNRQFKEITGFSPNQYRKKK